VRLSSLDSGPYASSCRHLRARPRRSVPGAQGSSAARGCRAVPVVAVVPDVSVRKATAMSRACRSPIRSNSRSRASSSARVSARSRPSRARDLARPRRHRASPRGSRMASNSFRPGGRCRVPPRNARPGKGRWRASCGYRRGRSPGSSHRISPRPRTAGRAPGPFRPGPTGRRRPRATTRRVRGRRLPPLLFVRTPRTARAPCRRLRCCGASGQCRTSPRRCAGLRRAHGPVRGVARGARRRRRSRPGYVPSRQAPRAHSRGRAGPRCPPPG